MYKFFFFEVFHLFNEFHSEFFFSNVFKFDIFQIRWHYFLIQVICFLISEKLNDKDRFFLLLLQLLPNISLLTLSKLDAFADHEKKSTFAKHNVQLWLIQHFSSNLRQLLLPTTAQKEKTFQHPVSWSEKKRITKTGTIFSWWRMISLNSIIFVDTRLVCFPSWAIQIPSLT